ncbi:MAG: hypothetical protein RLZ35_513 [Pseudomonadota bacterium]|jgi:tetratricopeptide (TPR) repeat protein
MKIGYLLTTGLLIHAGTVNAWVLDDTVSTPTKNSASGIETTQKDLFEVPEIQLGENNMESLLNTLHLMEDASSKIEEKNTVIKTDVEPIIEKSPPKLPHLEKKISSLTPKDHANKKYNDALQKIELNDHIAAEKLFTEILKEYPPHTLSRVQLSKLALIKKEYAKAEKWLTEQPEYFSSHPAYLQTLATVYERTGRKAEALKLLDQVPTQHRQNVEYYSLLASLYQQTGNYALAQRYYNGLLNREPNNISWLLGLSISLDSGGEKKMALTQYKKILERHDVDQNILSFVKNRFEQLSEK